MRWGLVALLMVLRGGAQVRAEAPARAPKHAPTRSAAPVRPAVLAVPLPTRQAGAEQVVARVRSIAGRVARHLDLPAMTPRQLAPPVDLAVRLRQARALTIAGSIDEAAVLLDVTLADGVRLLHRLGRPADLVAAHLWRVSIALARGEPGRAADLLARLLHYEPGLRLELTEDSPQMVAALDRASRATGEPPTPADLGDAARDHAVVITGRLARAGRDAGGAPPLELFRFDAGVLVATAISTGDRDDELAPLWRRPVDRAVVLAARAAARSARPIADGPSPGRSLRTAGIAAGTLGLVLAGVGTYFAVDAAARAEAINDDCDARTPCPGELLRERGVALDRSRLAGQILWLSGGAAITTGVIAYLVGWRAGRGDPTEAPARRAHLSLSGDGVGIAWEESF